MFNTQHICYKKKKLVPRLTINPTRKIGVPSLKFALSPRNIKADPGYMVFGGLFHHTLVWASPNVRDGAPRTLNNHYYSNQILLGWDPPQSLSSDLTVLFGSILDSSRVYFDDRDC